MGSNWLLIVRIVLRVLLVATPVVLASLIALNTRSNAHPDEFMHLDAFEYFGAHWLRPALGSDQVQYSINGISRVYNGEIVYLLYGKLGYLPRRIWPKVEPYYIYRSCNVALLLVTLTLLAVARCKWFAPWLLAVFLFCIPQVIYLYSYANSDAFGITASVLLFLQAARMIEQSPKQWSALRIATFMLLLLLTLLSKIAFEMDILLPLAILIFHLIRTRTSPKLILLRLLLPLLAVYVLAAWWNPQFSPHRAAWNRQMVALHEQKAIPGRRPGDPQEFGGVYPQTMKGLFMAANHRTYGQVLRFDHYAWFTLTGESVYGRFGYMSVILPTWIYATAFYITLALVLLTLGALWAAGNRIPWSVTLCIVAAPLLICFNLFGSIYHSFYFDWQPQGRYLFASIIPLFFLCFGTWSIQGRRWRFIHGLVLCLLIPLSCYVLIEYAVLNPALR